MKRCLVVCCAIGNLLFSRAVSGQGYFELNNYNPPSGINAPVFDADGVPLSGTNYENGTWNPSEDVIETHPDGAVALRGPTKAIFSPDLHADAVFDLLASDGQRLRGGVRAIQLTDLATGQSAVLATVKKAAPGQLLPPDRVVYSDAFDGLKADALYVWQHNFFCQDILLREQPELPPGMDPATTRLEVVTEFVEAPVPQLNEQVLTPPGQPQLVDDVIISFGQLVALRGLAFSVVGDKAASLGTWNPGGEGIPVLKQWHALADGRKFLVESVAWQDLEPRLKALPLAQRAQQGAASKVEVAQRRAWPKPTAPLATRGPVQVAALPYKPEGLVVDFLTIPDQGQPTTFTNGATYYIRTSYYSGAAVTFQPNCTIKYKNNAYMLLYGPVSFPSSDPPAVFTSRNDNGFGERIIAVYGEDDSNSDATLHKAAQAIWIYYVNFSTTVRHARVRWANKGLEYDGGSAVTHYLRDSWFEQSQVGLQNNLGSGVVSLSNVKQCCVTTPIVGTGYNTSGTMTADCGVVSVARVNPSADTTGDPDKNSQSECSFVVVDSSRIVAAFFDTHLSEYGLGYVNFPGIVSPRSTSWSVSLDGGVTFTNQAPIPPASPTNTTQGDVGDPVMARDAGNASIYLLTNPSRDGGWTGGFRLWASTNNGTTFSLRNTNVLNWMGRADKPMIAVDNFSGSSRYHYVYAAGTGTNALYVGYSTNGGVTWAGPSSPFTAGTDNRGADIAILPDGAVYVFWLASTNGNSIQYAWLPPGTTNWSGSQRVNAHTNSVYTYATGQYGSGRLWRFNGDTDPDDYFDDNAFPRVAVNAANSHIYLVYADLPTLGSTNYDHGDIYIQEGVTNADRSLRWSGAIKVNHDNTQTDQWNPAVTVNPTGAELFIGHYSRQKDPNTNRLIMAYGAKANLANLPGGTNFAVLSATFDAIPISTTAFPPMFPGGVTNTPPTNPCLYDHVWAQNGVCFDRNAWVLVDCGSTNYWAGPSDAYQHFMADDYTWATADGSYFYYAWCDRSDTYTCSTANRPDANIRLGKVKQ